jgi:hypothetical protein
MSKTYRPAPLPFFAIVALSPNGHSAWPAGPVAHDSPLHAGIQAGHAKAAISVLPGNLHLPDGLWLRSRGDFIDRCVVRRKGRGRAFVPILEHFGVAPKEGIIRSGRIGSEPRL